MKYIKNAAH